MALVNQFGVAPPWFNPGIGSRERIIRTICEYSGQTHLPPRFIAVDDIAIDGGAQLVASEMNLQVWSHADPSAEMVRYCQRNNVNSGVGLLGAFPLALLIGVGILAVVRIGFWAYKMFRRCCGGQAQAEERLIAPRSTQWARCRTPARGISRCVGCPTAIVSDAHCVQNEAAQ